jgi:hypothetical protein
MSGAHFPRNETLKDPNGVQALGEVREDTRDPALEELTNRPEDKACPPITSQEKHFSEWDIKSWL